MSHLDQSKNVLEARILFWGPAGSGKTAALEALRRFLDPEDRLCLYRVNSADGRTLFFDLLPLEDFTFGSYRVRTRLLAAPGGDAHGRVRMALAASADVVVFVADSKEGRGKANWQSLHELAAALTARCVEPTTVPTIFCVNRRDLPDAVPAANLRATLGCKRAHETVATDGTGIFECFSEAFRAMMEVLIERHDIVSPDTAEALPVRQLPQLARGGKIRFDRPRDAKDRSIDIRIPDEDAPHAVQAIDVQIRFAEMRTAADQLNRMLEGRNQELMAINRVARSILSAMEPDNLLVVLLDATAEYIGVTHASCVVFAEAEEEQLRTHVRGFGRDPVLALPNNEARYLFDLLHSSDGPVPVDDEHNTQLLRAIRGIDRRVRRALYQAIRGNNGKTAGWLGIYVTEEDVAITTQRLLFLSSISRLAALGLEKISLLEQMRETVSRQGEQLGEQAGKIELAKARIRALNRGLESRVTERTRALTESIRSLRDSRAAAIHEARLAGMGQVAEAFVEQICAPVDELKTGLEMLREGLDDLRASLSPEADRKAIEDFESILDESHSSTQQVSGVLSSLRRLSGEGAEEIDLNAALADAVTMLDPRIKACAELELRLGSIPSVEGEERELSDVLLALLTNAVEAMERSGKRGRLVVSTFASNNEVTLMVQDTGGGIAEELLPRVFEPFVTTKEGDTSAGLGLHIAYETVKRHHGTLKVRSKPGEGATVKLLLPVRAEAKAPSAPDGAGVSADATR